MKKSNPSNIGHRTNSRESADYLSEENGTPIPPRKKNRRNLILWLLLLIVLIIVGIVLWHRHNLAIQALANKRTRPIPVVLAVARTTDVPVYLSALGTVTPTYSVTVRTQINGQLLNVFFREGQIVKKGDLIAEIDPRPYLAQLVEFQGQLQRDQAQLMNARIDLKRYTILYPIGSVSQQTYETQKSLVGQLEGTVKLDQGQIDQVQVNLIYCYIHSPVDGRIGLRLVDPGNFVQTSDVNGLVIIDTIQPITVIFSLPEDNVPQVMQAIATGKPLITEAYDRTQNKLLATGTLLTIDNQINTTTGTVNLRGNFQNKNYVLFPNQFVNIQLLVDTLHNATVIPTSAVQRGPQGTFVYLLNKDNTVSVKPITTSVVVGDETTITAGVLSGQSVVVDGTDKLTDGAAVTVSSPTPQLALPTPNKLLNAQYGIVP